MVGSGADVTTSLFLSKHTESLIWPWRIPTQDQISKARKLWSSYFWCHSCVFTLRASAAERKDSALKLIIMSVKMFKISMSQQF